MTVFIRNHALAILAVCALGTAGLTYPAYGYIGSNAGSGQVRSDAGGDTQERNGLREGEQGGGLEAREAYGVVDMGGENSAEERAARWQERRAAFEEARTERLRQHFAQQSDMYNTLAERRATIVNASEERRAERAQNQEERRARLTVMAQKRLGGYGTSVTSGMEQALEQLSDVAGRVEARIARFNEEGIDVNAGQRVFAGDGDGVGVYALIDSARADVTVLANLLTEVIGSDDPKVLMADVREAAEVAKESIRLVHGALRDTVIELRSTLELNRAEEVTAGDEGGDGSGGGTEMSQ